MSKTTLRRQLGIACWVIGSTIIPSLGLAQSPISWRESIPQTAVVVVRVAPAESWLEAPAVDQLRSSDGWRKLWRTPQLLQANAVLSVAELALGMSTKEFLRGISEGGLSGWVDLTSGGAALQGWARSTDWLEEQVDRLTGVIAQQTGGKPEVRQYREATAMQLGGLIFVRRQARWLATGDKELAKRWVDQQMDDPGAAWEGPADLPETWKGTADPTAIEDNSHGALMSFWIDLETLRQNGVANDLLGGKAKDFNAELLLGGIMAVLNRAPHATADLRWDGPRLRLDWQTPYDRQWADPDRLYSVGAPTPEGSAQPLLELPDSLASLSIYRDLSQMWLRSGDLFGQEVNDQLAQADATLSTLFSGKDFGEEILGALKPQLRLIVVPKKFSEGQPIPSVQLPAFALVGELEEPERMRKDFRRIFQSLIGFLNVAGAQEGQPQLDMELGGDTQNPLVTASYVPATDREGSEPAPIQYNFRPTLAFADRAMILASDLDLATLLQQKLLEGAAEPRGTAGDNLLVEARATPLLEVLQANRESIIAQNMLEKGNTRQQAEGEWNLMAMGLSCFRGAGLRLAFDDLYRGTLWVELAGKDDAPTP
ncbi:MAG: hypothetical protein ACK57Y_16080 [Pirellulaceae bacterium]